MNHKVKKTLLLTDNCSSKKELTKIKILYFKQKFKTIDFYNRTFDNKNLVFFKSIYFVLLPYKFSL